MGHPSQQAIRRLPDAVTGAIFTDQDSDAPCETCRLAKATRIVSRRPGQEEPPSEPFHRISYDLMQYNDGFNGDNWASHFKCYLTGMNHIYTHPSKGHATDIVKEYVSMVKTRYGRTIRFMRADGETALAS